VFIKLNQILGLCKHHRNGPFKLCATAVNRGFELAFAHNRSCDYFKLRSPKHHLQINEKINKLSYY
ncbi:hypothetical protein L9F63_024198, partial [Diploptera punctata]